ncbi:MAG TPA: response regulator transcription factor [Firmicutes bacterium]|nr:response regulator transcription factor [Bacillales bacterium]HJA41999.1 response regulator transcription factor [Bacillota bacterium]
MNEKCILIIEDDEKIETFLQLSLKTVGYKVISTSNGLSGISLLLTNQPNLILLDLGLPDIDGKEVITQIRQHSDIPIIVLSAREEEREKVALLDLGADDYMTKPFHIHELFARIRVAFRHYHPQSNDSKIFTFHALTIHFDKRKVWLSDQEVHFTPIEYKLLSVLIQHQGKVLTLKYLQEQVWGYPTQDAYKSLRVFMANIRRKLNEDFSNPKYILTEVGVGYRFLDE